MINSILIANRGEIACRIIRTAKKLGIKSYVIYSTEDESSLAVKLADKAFLLKSTCSEKKEYLDGEQIISIAKKNKIEAIHPGYGFLSENSNFAKLVEDTGIKFIGPPYKAIEIMGDKIISKKHAKNIDVSTIPGLQDEIKSYEDAIKAADKIGFPLMIKASAGGGGKGMRIVYEKKELKDKFKSAKNEAETSFGDSRVFIEKFIEEPRHIEIQIVGDQFGNYLHLGERDCSIQRRNQKIIEESPSPFIDKKIRDLMAGQAIALAKSVNYFSAGTVEFIVDKNKDFYFLEMNTRLQVEHPVTEMVTGIDLVEMMIRIASKEKLNLNQSEISFNGSAIEARVYAEDPARDFMPSAGRLIKYKSPEQFSSKSEIIRNDTGVFEGSTISLHYDPMISKLCAWSEKRDKTIKLLINAINKFSIDGIKNNLNFLSAILINKNFNKGTFSTKFLEMEYPNGFKSYQLNKNELCKLSAAVLAIYKNYEILTQTDEKKIIKTELSDFNFFVDTGLDKFSLSWNIRNGNHEISGKDNINFNIKILKFLFTEPVELEVNSEILTFWCKKITDGFFVRWNGYEGEIKIFPEFLSSHFTIVPGKSSINNTKEIISPMPGLLVSVDVNVGDLIDEGQRLCAIEAMKMENVIYAERSGTIKSINFKLGDILSDGDTILEFE